MLRFRAAAAAPAKPLAIPAVPRPTGARPSPPVPQPDRVDRLKPDEQLTLKVASVLGLTVYRQLLQARIRAQPEAPAPASHRRHRLWHWNTPAEEERPSAIPSANRRQWQPLRVAAPRPRCEPAAEPTRARPAARPPHLQAIHPQRPSPAALEASLRALEAASFLGRDPQEPTTWRFCQVRPPRRATCVVAQSDTAASCCQIHLFGTRV